jgi:hypothetical protein
MAQHRFDGVLHSAHDLVAVRGIHMKGDYVEESTAATVHDLSQRGRLASIRATHEGVGIGLANSPRAILHHDVDERFNATIPS